MKKLAMLLLVSFCVMTLGAVADDHDMHGSKIQPSAQWEKMKTLVGQWEGTMNEGDQKFPATTSFRMTGDGSALLNMLGEGTKDEMVSMIHPDAARLMMTHYCAGHNQPRLKSVATNDPNKVAFDFLDITNAAPEDGRMVRVLYTMDGPDHHTQVWTYKMGSQETTATFDFKRKK